jgi:hypothetical protein
MLKKVLLVLLVIVVVTSGWRILSARDSHESSVQQILLNPGANEVDQIYISDEEYLRRLEGIFEDYASSSEILESELGYFTTDPDRLGGGMIISSPDDNASEEIQAQQQIITDSVHLMNEMSDLPSVLVGYYNNSKNTYFDLDGLIFGSLSSPTYAALTDSDGHFTPLYPAPSYIFSSIHMAGQPGFYATEHIGNGNYVLLVVIMKGDQIHEQIAIKLPLNEDSDPIDMAFFNRDIGRGWHLIVSE